MKKYLMIVASALLAVGFSSCHIYEKYRLPDSDTSRMISDYRAALENTDSVGLPYLGWEQLFTDSLLRNYIRQALAENVNLENARLSVGQARAQLKGAKLSYFPSLALAPTGGTSWLGGNQLPWSNNKWNYTIPLAANWEIDAFGKILNRKRGAKVGVEMAEAYEQAARSQIVCGVASCYYSLVMLHQQLGLLERTAEIWKDQTETMELMKQAARTNEAAVVQSKANYFSILASIPDLKTQINTVESTLSLLLNTYPQPWKVTSDLDFDLPEDISGGIPLTYLATRPDVRAAERSLAQAYYQTNSARAAFYPSISISATGGFTNQLGSMIKNPGEWFVNLAGTLTAPLFSRGQNIAQLEAAKAAQKQALNNFEYSVLNAASDVGNAMSDIASNREKRKYVEQQVDNLEKAVEYTQDLFQLSSGATYLEVLTARSALLNAQQSALACWHAKVAAIISLYQAVGGGR